VTARTQTDAGAVVMTGGVNDSACHTTLNESGGICGWGADASGASGDSDRSDGAEGRRYVRHERSRRGVNGNSSGNIPAMQWVSDEPAGRV
jgi:hypothetical protein